MEADAPSATAATSERADDTSSAPEARAPAPADAAAAPEAEVEVGAAEMDDARSGRLNVAERQFQQGIQAIKDDRLDDAISLFSQCLETRVNIFGAEAPETASAYYRYGAALLYSVQDSADVFGGDMQTAAQQHDEQADIEGGASAPGQPALQGGAGPSGAAALQGGSGLPDGAGPSSRPAAAEDDDDAAGTPSVAEADAAPTDVQLAWENLEMAKRIYTDQGSSHASELADVLMLLGDLSSEDDSFERALEDYQSALQLLESHAAGDGKPAPVQRVAELHFKASLALQFLNRVPDAVKHTKTAMALITERLTVLRKADAAEAGAGGAAAAATATPADATSLAGKTAADAEAERLKDSLEGLQERLVELQDRLAEEDATRNQLKAAYASAVAAMTSAAGDSAPAGGPAAAATSAAAQMVQDLGVVGRGKKRITMQPLPLGTIPTVGPATATIATAAPARKRSLADAMGGATGGGGGTTQIGFGGPPPAKQPASGSPTTAAPVLKRVSPATGTPAAPAAAAVASAAPSPTAAAVDGASPAEAPTATLQDSAAAKSTAVAAPAGGTAATIVSAVAADGSAAGQGGHPVQATPGAAVPAFLAAAAVNKAYGGQ